jgi:monothiol glutaredoxin
VRLGAQTCRCVTPPRAAWHRLRGGDLRSCRRRPAGAALPRLFATTADDDTHDDFKPKIKGQPSSTVAEQIEADVSSRAAFLYMKGVPEAPMCGFSQMACRILDAYGERAASLPTRVSLLSFAAAPSAAALVERGAALTARAGSRRPPAAAAGADYGSRDVLSDPELRDGIKKFTHWPTIPQIFIAGEFVGGSDILMQMHQSGELEAALLKAKGKQ